MVPGVSGWTYKSISNIFNSSIIYFMDNVKSNIKFILFIGTDYIYICGH
jgi:hypothetical protein